MNLGYQEMWDSFHKQDDEENWDKETRRRIAKEIKKGIKDEIEELVDLEVLKK